MGALQRAKKAVERHYAVVGVLEDLNSTLTVLENYIPLFFKGATQVYWGTYTSLALAVVSCCWKSELGGTEIFTSKNKQNTLRLSTAATFTQLSILTERGNEGG